MENYECQGSVRIPSLWAKGLATLLALICFPSNGKIIGLLEEGNCGKDH